MITKSDELLQEMKKFPNWYQRITVGDVITPGISDTDMMASRLAIPTDSRFFTGQNVLDIGAAEGYFSFKAKQQGAKQVDAIDYDASHLNKFMFIKEKLNLDVTWHLKNVYDIESLNTKYHHVFFLGVFYHLENPILALQKIYNVMEPGGVLYLESFVIDNIEPPLKLLPVMYYMPNSMLNEKYGFKDPTNFWAPTTILLQRMISDVGFSILNINNYSQRSIVIAKK